MNTTRTLATLTLVLALMGAAWAANVREVGSLSDDYQATLTVYAAWVGLLQVGAIVRDGRQYRTGSGGAA